jgi:hypothetical protein
VFDVLAFWLRMAVFRYSPESIDSLSRRIRTHHIAAVMIFTAVVCAAGFSLFELRAALIYNATFFLVIAVVGFRSRHKGRQRTDNLVRSTEFEIDDEKASWRSSLSKGVIYRSEIVEACFSTSGIWLRSKSRRAAMQFPSEIQDFDKLSALLQEWLPQNAVRSNSPPSSVWTYLQVYGKWAGAVLLLYAAMANQTRSIAIPACVLAATGAAWYLAWCGRKINERKWKVLLPVTGYLLAAALLGRAFTLFALR